MSLIFDKHLPNTSKVIGTLGNDDTPIGYFQNITTDRPGIGVVGGDGLGDIKFSGEIHKSLYIYVIMCVVHLVKLFFLCYLAK